MMLASNYSDGLSRGDDVLDSSHIHVKFEDDSGLTLC